MGLLDQAVALERHVRSMPGAALTQLSADLARICHGGNDTGPPRGPKDLDLACPICSSLASALLDAASPADLCAPPHSAAAAGRNAAPAPPRLSLLLRPPVRAPPLGLT